jgi:ATP-dependent protease Clp ATPase subunit
MIKSKASALTREVQLLEKDDIVFDHDDKFIDVIATKAYEQGMGGRGIKNNLEEIFTTVFSKVVLNEKPEYIDEETGKIYIYGTADDEDNIQIITANGENLLEEEEPIVKEESTTKVLKL